MQDPQSAWLLLVMCAATKANFWLRGVQPELTESFAETHDTHVWECLRQILKIPDRSFSQTIASLPFSQGGLGLVSASGIRSGAHWASSADCLRMVRQRHPSVAETMIQGLADGTEPCFLAVRRCAETLEEAEFEAPSWSTLAEREEVVFAEEPEPHEPKIGWQQRAVKTLHQNFHKESFWPELTDAEKTLMHIGFSPFHSCAHQQNDKVRGSTFQGHSVSTPPPPFTPVLTHLPMWPPTRPFWPPSCSVCRGGIGTERFSSGMCCSTSVQGGRSEGDHQRVHSRS